MAIPQETSAFDSWNHALSDGKLNPEQVAVLQKIVDDAKPKAWQQQRSFLIGSRRC